MFLFSLSLICETIYTHVFVPEHFSPHNVYYAIVAKVCSTLVSKIHVGRIVLCALPFFSPDIPLSCESLAWRLEEGAKTFAISPLSFLSKNVLPQCKTSPPLENQRDFFFILPQATLKPRMIFKRSRNFRFGASAKTRLSQIRTYIPGSRPAPQNKSSSNMKLFGAVLIVGLVVVFQSLFFALSWPLQI